MSYTSSLMHVVDGDRQEFSRADGEKKQGEGEGEGESESESAPSRDY